jgi:polysaccharide biosynthesis protein PelD
MAGDGNRRADTGFLPVLPPRFALVELAIFAVIIAAELWSNSFPDLTRLNPHPYWIAVLLLSLQYGTVSGLLAASLAIIGTLLIGLPEAEIGESYFSYLIRVWTQPVLWIVVALLLGSFRMRQIEERDGLQRQVDEAIAQSASLSGYAKNLKARVDGLERQIAAAARPETAQLLDALSSLNGVTSPEARKEAAAAALRIAFPTAKLSVFAVADHGGLSRVLTQNWPEGARWRTVIKGEEPLALAVVQDGRSLSVLTAADDALLAGEGKLVVPIFGPSGPGTQADQVIGAIKVEDIASRDFDATTVPRLAVLARHIAQLLNGSATVTSHSSSGSVIPLLRRLRLGGAPNKAASPSDPGMATTRPPIEPAS